MINKNVVKDYVIQYGIKALGLSTQEQNMLVALLHYWCMNKNNVCNPTRERLAMSVGYKKLDDITACGKRIEEKGWIVRTVYNDGDGKNSRVQYNINAESILLACKEIESEWYAKWKEETVADKQAEVIANPEQHTEQEKEEAINPPPKTIPQGMTKSPITGRLEKEYVSPVSLSGTFDFNNLSLVLSDTRTHEQQKASAENLKWNIERQSKLARQYERQEEEECPF